MIGIILGLLCGVIEFYLLQLLIQRVLSGDIPIWIPPVKMLVLAAFLVPCGIWVPGQLYLAGSAVAAVLIIGSISKFIMHMIKERQKKFEAPVDAGDEAR